MGACCCCLLLLLLLLLPAASQRARARARARSPSPASLCSAAPHPRGRRSLSTGGVNRRTVRGAAKPYRAGAEMIFTGAGGATLSGSPDSGLSTAQTTANTAIMKRLVMR